MESLSGRRPPLSFVLDCSATIAFLLPDESPPVAQNVLQSILDHGAWTPTHWRLEVANALASAIRRRRITRNFRDEALTDLALFPIRTDPQTHLICWTASLALANRLGQTIYDAAYLKLALRSNLPLATLDKDLQNSAVKMGASLIG